MHVAAGAANRIPNYTNRNATIGIIVMVVILVAVVAVILFVRRR